MRHAEPIPDGFKDAIYCVTDIHLDLKDRLKVLLGWRLTAETKTLTEHLPGRAESTAEVRVWRSRPLPDGWGVVMAGKRTDR